MREKMPVIPRGLSPTDDAIVGLIVSHRGATKGRLLASKPNISMVVAEDGQKRNNILEASAAYVWRMVAFNISPLAQHQCVPICADWDLPREGREAYIADLDSLVDRIVDSIPKEEWYGVIRWGNALGLIGEPEYDGGGAVVYR